MSVVLEKEGKTVSEATISACEELGVAREDIDVEVLKEGSKGVLGIGARSALVRVTVTIPDISEKGIRAKKTLEDLLQFFLENYVVELSETQQNILLSVKGGEEKGLIIGRRGEMLSSLEYMVGRIAGKLCNNGREKRVTIDVDGYQKRRERTIEKIVYDAARKAKKTGKPVYLERLPASERRIAYIILKKIHGIRVDTKEVDDGKTIIVIPTRRGGGGRYNSSQQRDTKPETKPE